MMKKQRTEIVHRDSLQLLLLHLYLQITQEQVKKQCIMVELKDTEAQYKGNGMQQ